VIGGKRDEQTACHATQEKWLTHTLLAEF